MIKAGILGGGQLGRMLLQAAANYPVLTYVMENDASCPSAHLCHHFIKGDISNYDEVYAFGKGLDVLTIEIEAVNADALEKLEEEGVKIFPKPAALKTIKNKIRQKEYYASIGVPSPSFVVTNKLKEVKEHENLLPAVHKLAMGGYDGKGVQLMHTAADMDKGFDEPAVLEKMVEIVREIALIIVVDQAGHATNYAPVEMIFNQQLNLLDYQLSPAALPETVLWKAEAIAFSVVKGFNSPGIFAVEFFVDRKNEVWVNETAPRVHNSGHHTIEACYSSQFDMLWRIMLNYPLGSTALIQPAGIINLLGEEGHEGEAHYEGLDEVLKSEGAFVHIYGKKMTKPGRKMGHITILAKDYGELSYQTNKFKKMVKVITNPTQH